MVPPKPEDKNDLSYVKMTDVDRAALVGDAGDGLVGTHCDYQYCNLLEFLPFFCQSCRHTFCTEHRSETAHACENQGAWLARRREAQQSRASAGQEKRMRDAVGKKPCANNGCPAVLGTGLVTGVHCECCQRDYCLEHRLPEYHDCANKEPLGARPAVVSAGIKSALDRFRTWGSAKREAAKAVLPKPKPTSRAAALVAVNTLKKTAKGDAKMPAEKRVYLFVEAQAETAKAKIPKGEFFYCKDWVVGRLLDAAARDLQVHNINNQSADENDRLRIFHVEGGRLLDFSEKVGASLASGNTVVLLRGVGPPPDLIDMGA